MKEYNKATLWWLVIGGFAILFLAGLIFGDAMDALVASMGGKSSRDGLTFIMGATGYLMGLSGAFMAYKGIAGLCKSNKGVPLKSYHLVRVILAVVTCILILTLNRVIGVILSAFLGLKHATGLIGYILLFPVLGWVWRAIVGDSNALVQKPGCGFVGSLNVDSMDKPKGATKEPDSSSAGFGVKSGEERCVEGGQSTQPQSLSVTSSSSARENSFDKPRDALQEWYNDSRCDNQDDSNAGCLVTSAIVFLILVFVISVCVTSEDRDASSGQTSSAAESDNRSQETKQEDPVALTEQTSKEETSSKKEETLAERANGIVIHDKNREVPVEIADKACWSPAQSNAVERFDTFWGVSFGMVVDDETVKRSAWFEPSGKVKHRYFFDPAAYPREMDSFYFSVTPKSRKVWRIASVVRCNTLRESVEEVDRMRRYVKAHTMREEHSTIDGSWVIDTVNTNRTIVIHVEKPSDAKVYFVFGEAYDNVLARQAELEGVSPGDDLQGLFGVNFGENADDRLFAVFNNNPNLYKFTPNKRFRSFTTFGVRVTQRSHTIYEIFALKGFNTWDSALAEAREVVEIFRTKFPSAQFKECEDMSEGYKGWLLSFWQEMESQRCIKITVTPDNLLSVTARADSDYTDLSYRERYQMEVDKLNADMDSL